MTSPRLLACLVAGATVLGACTPDPAPPPVTVVATTAAKPERVVAVGDSIMLGAREELEAELTGLVLDAEVGRQFAAGIPVLEAVLGEGIRADVVLVHLGTNGPVTEQLFDRMMATASGVPRVVFVNVKVPRPWEERTNEVLARGVARHPTAELVDWHAASVDRPDYFDGGGYHLRPPGVEAFVDLIASGL